MVVWSYNACRSVHGKRNRGHQSHSTTAIQQKRPSITNHNKTSVTAYSGGGGGVGDIIRYKIEIRGKMLLTNHRTIASVARVSR